MFSSSTLTAFLMIICWSGQAKVFVTTFDDKEFYPSEFGGPKHYSLESLSKYDLKNIGFPPKPAWRDEVFSKVSTLELLTKKDEVFKDSLFRDAALLKKSLYFNKYKNDFKYSLLRDLKKDLRIIYSDIKEVQSFSLGGMEK